VKDGCGCCRIHLALAQIHDRRFLTIYLLKEFDMKNLRISLLVLVAFICAGSLTSFASAPSVTITVTNNSSRDIRHLYLSPANNDNWGPDQLGNSAIGSGSSRQLNVSWEEATVKLVAEDQDGCSYRRRLQPLANLHGPSTIPRRLTAGTSPGLTSNKTDRAR